MKLIYIHFKLIVLAAAFTAGLAACSSPVEVPGFSKAEWAADPGGCEGIRRALIESADLENALIGIDESDIIDLLGQPDKNELYKRNQKFFMYSLGPCDSSSPAYFQLRFSATNVTREAMIYEGTPDSQ